ncbi:BTB/POZ domain-containing protein 7 [Pectinophora gossypiella]|uniref:BTB/POZ domain-containing protein 7 n=1 Tax=Pectinophora gossypiella TaxID=13191 RepID=UPI00214F1629|nr:BTB/POZ domain-containing protein 7 [Pectinophora gossypiella]
MSRLLCCLCVRRADMGAALSHPQEGDASEGAGLAVAPPTMADVIRERKKKAGGAGLGTLRRRLAAAARRPRDARPDRGCEHARFIRGVVSSWRLAEVFVLCEELEAGAALRDLVTQAELAREPAAALQQDLAAAYRVRWWCDVELVGAGWCIPAHRAILAARCTYFRELLQRYPSGTWRVPLEGAGASLSREEMESAVLMLYGGTSRRTVCDLCCKWNRGSDDDLDIINGDNTGTCGSSRGCSCGRGGREGGWRRLAALLGFTPDTLHTDLRYLLDSGEYADVRLVFRVEGGCGAQYGFRAALELPCHRLVLAARSRFFRSVMSRRGGAGGGGGCVCVDEKVLPRRFARALLHAAYTDQVHLSLIGRDSSSPSSTTSTASSTNTAWSGVTRGGGSRPASTTMLDDAFQLYEIARFLEMPIVVQGCEDAIVEALSADTLPHVLRWAAHAHASQWVHRQAMRYLRDEFPAVMSSAASARLPRSALSTVLASPFLQASEAQALRALLRWGLQQQHQPREPNVVWHTAHSVSRRGARRREVSDAALRETLGSLLTLVRVEHMPPDSELLQQAVRRGIIDPPAAPEEGSAADVWLGRGSYRPPRCFLPYLDELKALLETQAAPEAEVARHRRARLVCRIPDTLYMVAAARGCGSPGGADAAAAAGAAEAVCVGGRVRAALRVRMRELLAAPPALTAAALPAHDRAATRRQIALRAVREMSLPDACAELLLRDAGGADDEPHRERSSSGSGDWEAEPRLDEPWTEPDCCRGARSLGGSLRCASAGSLRSAPTLAATLAAHAPRAATCRRDLPARPDSQHHRAGAECPPRAARLSACVPDVAMAPNANTHLLTARDYCPHPPQPEYSPAGVLQLDLGDGATHTPRPGSRALRAAHSAERARQHRDHAQGGCAQPSRSRPEEDELRAALELSVIRAYSSLAPLAARSSATLPPSYRADLAHLAAGTYAQIAPPFYFCNSICFHPDTHLLLPPHSPIVSYTHAGSEQIVLYLF